MQAVYLRSVQVSPQLERLQRYREKYKSGGGAREDIYSQVNEEEEDEYEEDSFCVGEESGEEGGKIFWYFIDVRVVLWIYFDQILCMNL